MKKGKKHLYPISYNGKQYYEEDCDDLFVSFYHDSYALNDDCMVYISDGLWISPSGKTYDEDDD